MEHDPNSYIEHKANTFNGSIKYLKITETYYREMSVQS